MATVLLFVIYIGYIGLGIPDSLTGAAWPDIYTEFGLPISWASIMTVLSTAGTFVSSRYSPRLLNKYGVYRVTVVSTAMTAIALLLHSFDKQF